MTFDKSSSACNDVHKRFEKLNGALLYFKGLKGGKIHGTNRTLSLKLGLKIASITVQLS